MARTLGSLDVELTEAERAKFTAPLVLVHGLWDDPKSWRRFMGFLSHRGWRCFAVGWGLAEQRATLVARRESLARAIAELEDLPILVGHDLGGVLALQLAEQARAVVTIAPLTSASCEALAGSGTWLQRLRGSDRTAGRGLVAHYPAGKHIEPAALIGEVAEGSMQPPPAGASPRLVVAGDADSLAPPDSTRSLAAAAAAQIEIVPGGHALHLGDGWETAATTVHRWLIQTLGEELLALYEEAWADREED
jgi:pimeloyl-ACP methyl ester carboxylesterase